MEISERVSYCHNHHSESPKDNTPLENPERNSPAILNKFRAYIGDGSSLGAPGEAGVYRRCIQKRNNISPRIEKTRPNTHTENNIKYKVLLRA